MSDLQDSTTAIAQAKKAGLDVVFPKPNELQIDIDDDDSLKAFARTCSVVDQYWGIKSETKAPSKSGKPGRFHITIALGREVNGTERIALQSALGSDRMREVLSLIRLLEKDPYPTLFIERKEKK